MDHFPWMQIWLMAPSHILLVPLSGQISKSYVACNLSLGQVCKFYRYLTLRSKSSFVSYGTYLIINVLDLFVEYLDSDEFPWIISELR